jgi:hypothetical protein
VAAAQLDAEGSRSELRMGAGLTCGHVHHAEARGEAETTLRNELPEVSSYMSQPDYCHTGVPGQARAQDSSQLAKCPIAESWSFSAETLKA